MLTSTPTPSSTPAPIELTVTSDTLNVRSGPGTNYPKIGELRKGNTSRITGENAKGDWWQIAFSGQTGWVFGELVTVKGKLEDVPVVPAPPTPVVLTRCFVPRLRDYVGHKGCGGEIVGEVRDLGGRPFAAGQIEGTVPLAIFSLSDLLMPVQLCLFQIGSVEVTALISLPSIQMEQTSAS